MLFKTLVGFVVALKTTLRGRAHALDLEGVRLVLYVPSFGAKQTIVEAMKTDVRFTLTAPDKLGSSHCDWQIEGVPFDIRVTRPEHVVPRRWED